MNKRHSLIFLLCMFFAGLTACDKNDKPADTGGTAGTGKFVIAALPQAAQGGVADYLFTTDDLESGFLSTQGNGIEQDGTYRYYTVSKNIFFSMLYGQGNPGAVTAYQLNDQGKLNKMTNFQSETVQAFAPVDDDILMFKVSRRQTTENSQWYKVSTSSLTITGQGQVNTKALAGNGEMAHFSWIKQVGNKVFAPYFCIKGDDKDGFGTQYPDSSWIAVFNYPDMTLDKVIRDNRTSFIGAYFTDGLELVENGDVYAWSSPIVTSDGKFTSTKPAAVMRINKGTTEYDPSYFFNITEASKGAYVFDKLYLGNGNFIFCMSDKKDAYAGGAAKFAIVNVITQTFKWVTGSPSPDDVDFLTTNNYSPKDGNTGFIGITTKDGKSVIYKFDAASATATPGLTITGGKVTAINWLPAK